MTPTKSLSLALTMASAGLALVACRNPAGSGNGGSEAQSLGSNSLTTLPADCEIALTFDDGPNRLTPDLARRLRCEHDITATFFVTGEPITNLGQRNLDEIRRYGHLIANHTYSHPIANSAQQDKLRAQGVSSSDPRYVKVTAFTDLNLKDKLAQVQQVHDLIKNKVFGNVFLFRSPGGNWNAETARQLNALTFFKYYVGDISWDVPREGSLIDFQCSGAANKTPVQCAESYWQDIRARNARGTTVLLHDLIPDSGTYANQHYTMAMLLGENGLIKKIKANKCMLKNEFIFKRLDQTQKVRNELVRVQAEVRAEQLRLGMAQNFTIEPGAGIPAKNTVCK